MTAGAATSTGLVVEGGPPDDKLPVFVVEGGPPDDKLPVSGTAGAADKCVAEEPADSKPTEPPLPDIAKLKSTTADNLYTNNNNALLLLVI